MLDPNEKVCTEDGKKYTSFVMRCLLVRRFPCQGLRQSWFVTLPGVAPVCFKTVLLVPESTSIGILLVPGPIPVGSAVLQSAPFHASLMP